MNPDDLIPRCEHGNIILGCPHDDCTDQTLYLIETATRLAEYEAWQLNEARKLVRPWAADWSR